MVEIFKIGFLSITLLDIIDIAIVSFIIYKLYRIIRGTIAAQIFIGLIVVLLLSFLAQAVDLKALGWLLELVRDIWVIAFIILFQPEIRRLLMSLGKSPLFRPFVKKDEKSVVDVLTDASFEMAQKQHGALIVVVKSTGLAGIAESGEILNAKLNRSLLTSIFYPRSPLHDGAVIVKNNIIEAAGCTLPLSTRTSVDGQNLGMRHRAGLGISEQADVLSILVSEETGGISIAEDGKLIQGLSRDSLRKLLETKLHISKEKGIKGIFESFGKSK